MASGKEVLLCLNKEVYIVDVNGKVSATKSASWSKNPSIMVVSGLHLVALVPGGIEVQLLAPRTALKLSQEIKMKDYTVLCALRRPEGGVFLGSATTGQIVCLLPLQAFKQAEQLLNAGAFEDALEVSRKIPDSQVRKIALLNPFRGIISFKEKLLFCSHFIAMFSSSPLNLCRRLYKLS